MGNGAERSGFSVVSQRESRARGFSKLPYSGNQGSGAFVIRNWILERASIALKESLALVYAEIILRERNDYVS